MVFLFQAFDSLWESIEDIKLLIGFFYGDKDETVSPSIIGEKCFDKVLGEIKK